MGIIIGELMTIFGIFYSCSILLAVRNPGNDSWWIRPIMLETVHIFITLGCLVLGPVIILKTALKLGSLEAIGFHALLLVVLTAVTVWLVRKMHISERLAEFDAKRAKIIDFPPQSSTASNDDDSHPASRAA